MATKEAKREFLFYDQQSHSMVMRDAQSKADQINEAVTLLKAILKDFKTDYNAFLRDGNVYISASIKEAYKEVFSMLKNLNDEQIYRILGIEIDLIKLTRLVDSIGQPQGIEINKDGFASASTDRKPYEVYATTEAHFERLAFSKEVISICERAYNHNRSQHKGNVISGLTSYVINDPEKGYIPNWMYIINGI